MWLNFYWWSEWRFLPEPILDSTYKKLKTTTLSMWLPLFFGGSGWIRTTEAKRNRFTVCPLWPLGNASGYFVYKKKWSWWTDSNPRPADYKSAALPTELHQRSLLNYYITNIIACQVFFKNIFEIFVFEKFPVETIYWRKPFLVLNLYLYYEKRFENDIYWRLL